MEKGAESDGRNGGFPFCNLENKSSDFGRVSGCTGLEFCYKGASETQGSKIRLNLGSGAGGGGTEVGVGSIYGQKFLRTGTNMSKQLFDNFPYKSPAMATEVEFPFTFAQWKELQVQAMIYKYMASSIPVPPELLHRRNFVSATMASPYSSSSSSYLRMRNRDLEPGRCKRTDGKKWRCSRDVAPHQKYCERHLHRGRPRSRKHVETKPIAEDSHKKSRIEPPKTCSVSPVFINDQNQTMISQNREMIEQPWQNFMEATDGGSIYSFNYIYTEQRQPLHFPAPEIQIGAPISISTATLGDFPLQIQQQEQDGKGYKDSSSRYLMTWETLAGGGPLAEALHHGICAVGSGSPLNESISTPATTVSSPSGVLPRNSMFPNSGGSSVCNSPTFAAETALYRWY